MTEQVDSIQKLAFFSALGLLFLRLSVIPELVYSFTGINTYLLYLFAPAAILGALVTGGIPRTMRNRVAWLWVGFFAWMILATPFSYWPGGSFARIVSYGRVDFVFIFVIGGLLLNWSHVRAAMLTIGTAAMLNVAMARFLGSSDTGGRVSLGSVVGSIGNSNDLAAHLLLVLPLAGFICLDRARNAFLRFFTLAIIAIGLLEILGTGSRGALIGLALAMLVYLYLARGTQRATVLIGLAVVAVVTPLLLPQTTMARLESLFGEQHEEAQESARSREYLFHKSLDYTLEYPVFGVGPDQFANFEGQERVEAGLVGNWHATHCAWTQVSSECGLPAFLMFTGALFGSLGMVWRTNRRARREGFLEIQNATLCYLTAMVAYLGAITFLSNAYSYYLPAMIGLAIAMTATANRFMDQSRRPAPQAGFPVAPILAAR